MPILSMEHSRGIENKWLPGGVNCAAEIPSDQRHQMRKYQPFDIGRIVARLSLPGCIEACLAEAMGAEAHLERSVRSRGRV